MTGGCERVGDGCEGVFKGAALFADTLEASRKVVGSRMSGTSERSEGGRASHAVALLLELEARKSSQLASSVEAGGVARRERDVRKRTQFFFSSTVLSTPSRTTSDLLVFPSQGSTAQPHPATSPALLTPPAQTTAPPTSPRDQTRSLLSAAPLPHLPHPLLLPLLPQHLRPVLPPPPPSPSFSPTSPPDPVSRSETAPRAAGHLTRAPQ